MGKSYYRNTQREIQVEGLAEYITIKRAAELLGASFTGLDSYLRRNGCLVVRVGDQRVLLTADLPELRARLHPRKPVTDQEQPGSAIA